MTGPTGSHGASEPSRDLMDSRQCTATSKQSGQRCRRPPSKGTTVCAMHGGKIPAVQAAAARRQAERKSRAAAAKAVAEWAPDMVPTDPGDVLLRATHVTWLQAALHRQQLAMLEKSGGQPYVRVDKTGREYPSALAVLEQTERRMAADMAAKAVGADLMGRHLRLMERYGDTIADVAEALLAEFGLDPTDPEVRRRVRRVMLAVAGSGEAA